eukprot:6712797-Prorocentrum_lima.AAC.1
MDWIMSNYADMLHTKSTLFCQAKHGWPAALRFAGPAGQTALEIPRRNGWALSRLPRPLRFAPS